MSGFSFSFFYHAAPKKERQKFEKTYFFKTMVGTFFDTCTGTGYPCSKLILK